MAAPRCSLPPEQDLPEGPYLANMRCMHLGNNHFQRFPSALLTANKVRSGGGALLCSPLRRAARCAPQLSLLRGRSRLAPTQLPHCKHASSRTLSLAARPLHTAPSQLDAVYLANQSGWGWGGGSGRSSPSSVSSTGSQARPAPGATQRLLLYDTGGLLLGGCALAPRRGINGCCICSWPSIAWSCVQRLCGTRVACIPACTHASCT